MVDLGTDFVRIAREHLESPEVEARVLYLADSYASFEGWLNWELAFAFSRQYPWPDYTAEFLPEGLADLALYHGEEPGERGPVALVRTRTIWDDDDEARNVEAAGRDERRIAGEGDGVLLLVAVSAGAEVEGGPRCGSAAELILRAEKALSPETRITREVVFDRVVKPGAAWYLAPRILIAAYRIGG